MQRLVGRRLGRLVAVLATVVALAVAPGPAGALLLVSVLAVQVEYPADPRHRLPTPDGLAAVREVEDAVVDACGADAVLVAHDTCGGTRTLFLYCEGDGPAPDRARLALGGRRAVRLEVWSDPAWEAVREFR